MGFFSVMRGALSLLMREPVLFLPKLVSTALYIPPYLIIMKAFASVVKNPLMVHEALDTAWLGFLALLCLMPLWLFLDSLYPLLVQQRLATGKLDFRAAGHRVLARFLRVLAFSLVLLIAVTLATLPFTALIAFGWVSGLILLSFVGVSGIVVIFFVSAIYLYFAPTALMLENGGVFASLRRGVTLSRQNFTLVFFLTLASFSILVLGTLASGTLEAFGDIGFVAGRLLGAIVTVYLYVVNPAAYLDVHEGKANARGKTSA